MKSFHMYKDTVEIQPEWGGEFTDTDVNLAQLERKQKYVL